MRKQIKRHLESMQSSEDLQQGLDCVENFKRRRALPFPSARLIERDLLFFDRLFQPKKFREFVFVTKAEARLR
ncbi:MAG: hypothetical protein WCG06_04235 [Candidatus Omnitrophota bacterium]